MNYIEGKDGIANEECFERPPEFSEVGNPALFNALLSRSKKQYGKVIIVSKSGRSTKKFEIIQKMCFLHIFQKNRMILSVYC